MKKSQTSRAMARRAAKAASRAALHHCPKHDAGRGLMGKWRCGCPIPAEKALAARNAALAALAAAKSRATNQQQEN